VAALDARAFAVMDAHWRPRGYTVPNADTYPHQWLWDSCFHSIVWAHLGRPDRALAELGNVFAHQGPDGFVPHITYWVDPDGHADFWGRRHTSCLTQPPMYGHAVAELVRRGVAVPDELVVAARRGLDHLSARPRPSGLVPVFHPWETGCDDSPRWDAWVDGPWTRQAWYEVKGDLVASLEFADDAGSTDDPASSDGSRRGPVGNPAFHPGSAMMTALVAFNHAELAWATGDTSVEAADRAAGLGTLLAPWWDAGTATWLDAPGGAPVGRRGSGAVRTLEALLGLLAPTLVPRPDQVDAAVVQLVDPGAFGAPYGPAQVHRDEPAFDPERYWRGPAWPQLSYLAWLGARRHGRDAEARVLAEALVRGVTASGFAEHWHPDTGEAQGAAPQSWSCLAAVVWAAEHG
jgi:hypothetical protein